MFDYFETEKAVYSIYNGKHYKHMKEWDKIPGFKYHKIEISVSEYAKAYRANTVMQMTSRIIPACNAA